MTLGLPKEQGDISTLAHHCFWNTNALCCVYSSPFNNYIRIMR